MQQPQRPPLSLTPTVLCIDGYYWHPAYGYGPYGYGYHGSSSSSDWSDDCGWSSDDYWCDDDCHDYDDCHGEEWAIEVGEDDIGPDVETELPELDGGAFDDEDAGGGDDGDDDNGDDDMAEVEAYASAGPQRWWKGGGGTAGATSVRVTPPCAHTGGKFGDWFERTWWKMSQEAFNSAILGRPNPASLPFKIETFRCDVSKLAPNAITLVTQCSVDRLPQLEAQARAWNGPISVAIFVKSPDTDLPSIANIHARLLETTNAAMEITLVHALPEDDDDFSEYDTLYPINTLVRPTFL